MPEAVKKTTSRTRSIAFCGLTIALLAVSAWITVPFGPVPYTLQTFVVVFALIALSPRECLAAIGGYLLIGAIGVPVFSAMRGGLGVIAGPTGGFLWGYLIGAAIGLLILYFADTRDSALAARAARVSAIGEAVVGNSRHRKRRDLIAQIVAATALIVIMYACGWLQLMVVTGMDPAAAFASAIAPFVVVDIIKTVLGVTTARAVKHALR